MSNLAANRVPDLTHTTANYENAGTPVKSKLPDLGGYSMYAFYTKKLLEKNPTYKGFWDSRLRTKGVSSIFKVEDYVKTFVVDYALFAAVIACYNRKVTAAVTAGERVSLGHGLGYIEAKRIERNYNRPKMNVIATVAARKAGDLTARVYFTDDDYCRISWKKTGNVRNCYAYEFKPTYGFRKEFSGALNANKLLQYKYPFHAYEPIVRTEEEKDKIKVMILKRQERNARAAA
jgi:hypothetical protein